MPNVMQVWRKKFKMPLQNMPDMLTLTANFMVLTGTRR